MLHIAVAAASTSPSPTHTPSPLTSSSPSVVRSSSDDSSSSDAESEAALNWHQQPSQPSAAPTHVASSSSSSFVIHPHCPDHQIDHIRHSTSSSHSHTSRNTRNARAHHQTMTNDDQVPQHSSAASPPSPSSMRTSSNGRILITGGAGFIGSHVCRALLTRGESIVIVDNLNNYYSPSIKRANLTSLLSEFGQERVHIYIHDICDRVKMQQLFANENIDRIIHLAARAGVRPSIAEPLLYETTNIQGTLILLELASHLVRKDDGQPMIQHFVYASSSSVYGDTSTVPFQETDPCNTPVSIYAATKKSCELLAESYSHLYKLPCSGMRFFTVYGENGRRDMAPFIFIDRLARDEEIVQFGDGTTERDYTYISDIVDGVLKVLDHVPGYTIKITSPMENSSSSSSSSSSSTLSTMAASSSSSIAASASSSSASSSASSSSSSSLHGDHDIDLDEETLHSANPYHSIYNLGVGSPISLTHFIQTISSILGVVPRIKILPKQPGDVDRTYADVRKARKLLGYEPRVSVQEGIRRTVEWYLKMRKEEREEEARGVMMGEMFQMNITQQASSAAAPSLTNSTNPTSPSTSALSPLPRSLCATRIHNQGSSRLGLSPEVSTNLLSWLPHALACCQYVAIAVDATNTMQLVEEVRDVVSGLEDRVTVLPVAPWFSFIPALNALLGQAIQLKCETILYSSLEMDIHPIHIHSLSHHLHDDTLVVGARVSGHAFHPDQKDVVIDGCTTIWNTLALWNTRKLARTGFLMISDGLPESTAIDVNGTSMKQPAIAGGVEEVVVISTQQLMFPTSSKAKLLSLECEEEEEEVRGEQQQQQLANTSESQDRLLYDDTATPTTTTRMTRTSSDPSATTTSLPHHLLRSHHSHPNASFTYTKTKSRVPIPSLYWSAVDFTDPVRAAAHEKKMKSKIERPQSQLEEMKIKPGVVQHIKVVMKNVEQE